MIMFYYIQSKYHSWCVYMDGSVHHEDINVIESWNHCEETKDIFASASVNAIEGHIWKSVSKKILDIVEMHGSHLLCDALQMPLLQCIFE